jgi:hypothetical protein
MINNYDYHKIYSFDLYIILPLFCKSITNGGNFMETTGRIRENKTKRLSDATAVKPFANLLEAVISSTESLVRQGRFFEER